MLRMSVVWGLTMSVLAGWAATTSGVDLPNPAEVVAAFEAMDKATHDGKGLSESPDSSSLGWGESSWLGNYWTLYELTGQTRWWDKIIQHFDRMIANMSDSDGDGFKSWQTKRYSTALVRAEPLHNRGSATIRAARAKITDGDQAAKVTGHRYLIAMLDAKRYTVRDATTAKVLVPEADYASGKPIAVATHVNVVIEGRPAQGDTFSIQTTAPEAIEYVVHQGMVLTPLARFMEAAFKRPADDTYHRKAKAYLAVIEKHFLHGNEKYWTDTGDGAGAYRFTTEPTERYPNRILPHNQYLALARAWMILADATGKELFRKRTEAMARNFKRALRVVEGAYEWHYWDWIENGQPGHSGIEDTSHGHIDVGFVVEAVRRGTVFDDQDALHLARTLLNRMWNGSTTRPMFGGRVDTKEGKALPLVDWVDLCRWDPKVLDLVATAVTDRYAVKQKPDYYIPLLAAKKRMAR